MKDQIIEIALSKPYEDEIIDASFQDYFHIGSQKYVAIKDNSETYLLKVIHVNGKVLLEDIQSQHEFDAVREIFLEKNKSSP